MLNCRTEENVNPVRVICDTNLKIPLDSNIVKTAKEIKTIIAYSNENEKEKIEALKKQNITLLKLPYNNGVDLKILMCKLGEMGIDSVLIEGGSSINASAIQSRIVNKVYAYIAPKIIAGKNSLSPIEGKGIEFMKDAIRLDELEIKKLGTDYLISRKCS